MEVTLLYMTDDSDVPQTYQTEEPFRMSYTCELCCQDSLQSDPLQYRTDRHHQRPGGGQIHPAPELLRRAAGG